MQTIRTKYHGPAGARGSRISATASGGKRCTVSYEHAFSLEGNHDQAARALCDRMGWAGKLCSGELADGSRVYVWVGGEESLVRIRKPKACERHVVAQSFGSTRLPLICEECGWYTVRPRGSKRVAR